MVLCGEGGEAFGKGNCVQRLVGVPAASDLEGASLEDRLKIEKMATYRDLAQVLGCFEAADFI